MKTATDRLRGTAQDPAGGLLARLMAAAPLYGAKAGALEIVIDNDQPTLATNGRTLVVNEEFFSKLRDDEAMIVLAHEAAHAHDDHPHRSGWRYTEDGSVTKGRDPKLWNFACDYSVNAKLVACGIATPAAIARLGGLYDPQYPVTMSPEEIYYRLESQQYQQQKQQQQADAEPETGSGDAEPGGQADDQQAGEETQDGPAQPQDGPADQDGQAGAQAGPTLADAEPVGKFGRLLPSPADYDADASYQEKMLSEAVSEAAGTLPADMARALHTAGGFSDTDWRALLARFADAAGRGAHDFSYRRPNYRAAGGDYRLILPGFTGSDPVRILVALDLSGSISDTEARRYLDEIDAMLATMPDIEADVCTFDSRAYGPWPIRETPDTLPGGGGTDVTPVFAIADDTGYRAVIVMTDGYLTPPPEPTFPVLWMLCRPNATFAPAYGDVAPMFDAWRNGA